MAKKKANNDFNMSAEIRNLLRAKRTIMGREVYNALVEKFPKQIINKNSCLVAVYKNKNRTKKAGKKKSVAKKTVKRQKPTATVTAVDLNALQAAAKFVAQIGSADEAIAAIKQLESFQIR